MKFDLAPEELVVPDVCPVLGLKIESGARYAGNSPSVDRFDNAQGYVKDKVRIISRRANSLKSDATVAEMQAVLAYMEGELTPRRARLAGAAELRAALARMEASPRDSRRGHIDVARILELKAKGLSGLEIAAEMGIGKSSVYRVIGSGAPVIGNTPSGREPEAASCYRPSSVNILRGIWMSIAWAAHPLS